MSYMDEQHAQILRSLLRERDALLQRLKILENVSRVRIRPGPSVSSDCSSCSAGSSSPEPGELQCSSRITLLFSIEKSFTEICISRQMEYL